MANPPVATASALSYMLAGAMMAGVAMYFVNQANSAGLFGGPTASTASISDQPKAPITSEDDDNSDSEEDEEEEEEEAQDEQDLKGFEDTSEECKLVLVVRTDLGMTKGKIAAQASHATLACYKSLASLSSSHPSHNLLRRWERQGQAKVALQVKSEDDLLLLQAQAVSLGICAKVIHDAGRTQIASGSATVLGVGPAPKGMVDKVTGHLKLL
ncbi:hypothetical protein LTS18_002652 [Coniosporium uncinatum]|uniref:Uncharacterized protein n=1 Tax=Coniosporium uncinatum TaxID=93489 RepID=A0ACC3D874_9PEZI|nr:hypothetical protein LTS18_002652 [Coniosporium uncinatum]